MATECGCCFGDMSTKMGCVWLQKNHDAMQHWSPGSQDSRRPRHPSPPGPRQLTAVSHRGSSRTSADIRQTLHLWSIYSSLHRVLTPDCWTCRCMFTVMSSETNGCLCATTEMSTTTSKTATVAPPRISTLSPSHLSLHNDRRDQPH